MANRKPIILVPAYVCRSIISFARKVLLTKLKLAKKKHQLWKPSNGINMSCDSPLIRKEYKEI